MKIFLKSLKNNPTLTDSFFINLPETFFEDFNLLKSNFKSIQACN